MYTILLIDDDPIILSMLESFLAGSGHTILTVDSAKTAFKIMEDQKPDLIVSDIMMPDMDGYEMRRKLLSDERLKYIPFIFLSSKGESRDIVKGMEMKVDDYIAKPFDSTVLKAKINAVLQRYDGLYKLIHYDPLTGLYNRRAVEMFLKDELERAKRYNRPLGVISLDLDHFKNLNDRFGHDFGDDVLKITADVLKANIREIDYAGRYGGEEFIIIMPETDRKDSKAAAERLRLAVQGIHFDNHDVSVTISGGMAIALEDGDNIADLLKSADVALYNAKNSGRNLICGVE